MEWLAAHVNPAALGTLVAAVILGIIQSFLDE